MHATALTDMEKAGLVVTVSSPSREELLKLALHYGALRCQGHAILCDETLENDGVSVLRFTHFLSCTKCKEKVKKENGE